MIKPPPIIKAIILGTDFSVTKKYSKKGTEMISSVVNDNRPIFSKVVIFWAQILKIIIAKHTVRNPRNGYLYGLRKDLVRKVYPTRTKMIINIVSIN